MASDLRVVLVSIICNLNFLTFNTFSRFVIVSLGDLGESKPVFPDTTELFAGTTKCFELTREYLDGFKTPFEVVGGNHDLEGIDEFPTDQLNLEAYMRILGKPTPQFIREIAPKVVLVGLGSVLFRDAVYTSHEVVVDDAQIDWFEEVVKARPAEEGWKIFCFSHAPPMGSGLRVLQENHVVNGCCWPKPRLMRVRADKRHVPQVHSRPAAPVSARARRQERVPDLHREPRQGGRSASGRDGDLRRRDAGNRSVSGSTMFAIELAPSSTAALYIRCASRT